MRHVILIRSQLAWRTTTTEFGGRFDPETLSVQLSVLGTRSREVTTFGDFQGVFSISNIQVCFLGRGNHGEPPNQNWSLLLTEPMVLDGWGVATP